MQTYKPRDIVWAKSSSTTTFSPALIISTTTKTTLNDTNNNNVLVSFFNFKPRQRVNTSQLLAFCPNFHSLIHTITDTEVFKFALKLWAQRVVESLTCACLVPRVGVQRELGTGVLEVSDVLGFVRRVGLRPWVEDDEEIVEGVTVAAKIKVIRRYFVRNQKRIYQAESRANRFKHPSSCMRGEEKCAHNANFEGNWRLSEQVNKDLTASVTDGMHPGSVILRGSSKPLHTDLQSTMSTTCYKVEKVQSLQNLLAYFRTVASNPFNFGEEGVECMNTVKLGLLRFRNLSYQNLSDLCSSNCSSYETKVAHISDSDLSDLTNASVEGGEISSSIVPFKKSLVSLGLKRSFDQTGSIGPCSKLQKTTIFFSLKEAGEQLQSFRTNYKVDLPSAFFPGFPPKSEDHKQISFGTHGSTSLYEHSLISLMRDKLSVLQGNHSSHLDIMINFFKFQEFMRDLYITNSFVDCKGLLEPKKCTSILTENLTSVPNIHDLRKRIMNGNLAGDVKLGSCLSRQPLAIGSGLENEHRETDAGWIDVASSSGNHISESHPRIHRVGVQPINEHNDTSFNSAEVTTNLALKSSFQQTEVLNQPCPFQTSIKSQKKMRPGGLPPSASKAKKLQMKFPRGFHLPSKEELIKIFNQFGSVDASETKVYSYTGSALVVFKHHADAVAAYQYATRKKVLFGQANVIFWFDLFESKRRGAEGHKKPLIMKHPGLKSCLKSSNTPKKDFEKKLKKVMFQLETP